LHAHAEALFNWMLSTDGNRAAIISVLLNSRIAQPDFALSSRRRVQVLQSFKHPAIVRYLDVFIDQEEGGGGGMLVCTVRHSDGSQFEICMESIHPSTAWHGTSQEHPSMCIYNASSFSMMWLYHEQVMELCKGGDLAVRLRNDAATDNPPDESLARRWLSQLAGVYVLALRLFLILGCKNLTRTHFANRPPPHTRRRCFIPAFQRDGSPRCQAAKRFHNLRRPSKARGLWARLGERFWGWSARRDTGVPLARGEDTLTVQLESGHDLDSLCCASLDWMDRC